MVKTTHADTLSDAHRRRAEHIGHVCRARRKALELSRAAMARRIGISPGYYRRLEQGTALPGVKTFAALVTALQVRADELLELEPASEPSTPSEITLTPDGEALYHLIMEASPDVREIAQMLLDKLNQWEKTRRKGA